MSDNDYFRQKTRRERYLEKASTAIKLPFSVATVNFDLDENLALTIRTAACFGAQDVLVIGKVPSRSYLQSKTGSLIDFIDVKSFPNPQKFLEYVRERKYKIVSAEKYDGAVNLSDYYFDFEHHHVLVTGNETLGVPVEILKNSDVCYIHTPGIGFCLNTSQASAILMSKFSEQFLE